VKYRTLYKSNIKSSVLGFGCWGLGGEAYGSIPEKKALKILDFSYEKKINFFDTSDLYGYKDDGRSEIILGKAFKKKRDKVIIASKFGLLPHKGWHMPECFEIKYLSGALERSLQRIQSDYLDIIQLHSPSIETLSNKKKMFEIINFLERKKKEGKIKYYGISTRTPQDAKFVATNYSKYFKLLQTNFNLIDQRIIENGLIDICKEKKIKIIARTPLVYGFLTGKINQNSRFAKTDHRNKWSKKQLKIWSGAKSVFNEIANKKKMTMTQLCLNFCMSHKEVLTTIPGMLNISQIKENIKSVDFVYLNNNLKKNIFNKYKDKNWTDLTLKKKLN
jgi:aryl-alcohol dehydrogenase-like predicted oxidoreductase